MYNKKMRRTKPGSGKIYHIYNRGVEKRNIFLKDSDRIRFLYSLLVFNNIENADMERHYFEPTISKLSEVGLRNPIVKIMAFVLMPNHYHLMVEQVEENGITEFMRKLGTGYTNYFNKKYERVGALFQGKYKAIALTEERHFKYLPYYIHLNPLEIAGYMLKKESISDTEKALAFLESYRWSSHLDYLGKPNLPNLLDTKLLNEVFETPTQYKNDIREWLNENIYDEVGDVAID